MNNPVIKARRIEPAYVQVAHQLRDAIVHGDVDPGSQLPTEPKLSEMFGVSRSTIREALRVLSAQNLVMTVRGVKGGTFVAQPSAEDIADFLETSLGLLSRASAVSVDELIEARTLLEVPATRLAATRRSGDQLSQMWAAVEAEEQAVSAGFAKHAAMHTLILQASGNGLLTMMTTPIFSVLRNRFQREEAPKQFWTEVAHDHRSIVELIEAGDAEGAAAEMASHLDDLRGLYQSIDTLPTDDGTAASEPTGTER